MKYFPFLNNFFCNLILNKIQNPRQWKETQICLQIQLALNADKTLPAYLIYRIQITTNNLINNFTPFVRFLNNFVKIHLDHVLILMSTDLFIQYFLTQGC